MLQQKDLHRARGGVSGACCGLGQRVGRVSGARPVGARGKGEAPKPHVAIAVAATFYNDMEEKAAHEHFARFRREGEFFAVSIEEVSDLFGNSITKRCKNDLQITCPHARIDSGGL